MTLDDLYFDKEIYEGRVASLEKTIRNLERTIESMTGFKTVVRNTKTDFLIIKRINESSVGKLDSISETCRSAKVYSRGIKGVLGGMNAGAAEAAMSGLETILTTKLSTYKLRVLSLEQDLDEAKYALERVKQQIITAEQEVINS